MTGHPTRAQHRTITAWLFVVVAAMLASACSGGGTQSEETQATLALAEKNQAQLQLSDNLAQSELLDGESGQITKLGDVVTGDRAVLVWYWAPN